MSYEVRPLGDGTKMNYIVSTSGALVSTCLGVFFTPEEATAFVEKLLDDDAALINYLDDKEEDRKKLADVYKAIEGKRFAKFNRLLKENKKLFEVIKQIVEDDRNVSSVKDVPYTYIPLK